MSTPRTSTNRNETFGRLLSGAINSIASYEGKTAPIIEDELGQQIGVAGKTIQRYKAGYLPPEARTVQILATAAVQRGFLGREWLQRFLHATRHHQADALLDQLCPLGPARPRPPRVYENLPAPTYSQFVMREQAFGEITDGLGKRTAAVLIVGMGGNGKTSLAREVAAACLKDDEQAPRFDSVVWVSDKDRPGTTNLSTILDEIARTLDYPGFTQFEHDEKRREVEQLLRRQRVLLVVDNFETISDGALLTWLLRLPEPSKALITSREKHRSLWGSWLAELRGMSAAEAETLIAQRLRALQLSKIAGDPSQFEPLIIVTGGNPKAIEMALGLIKHERRPLQQVVDDLYAARGEIFDNLFTRAWSLLDEAARRVLLVSTFFPTSTSAEALSASADVQGFAFDRAVERLADLALLDIQQEDLSSPPRYVLHPLVQAFANAKLTEQPGFEEGARERWVAWYVQLAKQVGYCWDAISRLRLLDPEQGSINSVLQWAVEHQYHREVIKLTQGVGYFYHVRGIWDKKIYVESQCAMAAHALHEYKEEIVALAYLAQILSRQGNLVDTEQYLAQIQDLTRLTPPSNTVKGIIHQSQAMYLLTRNDLDGAYRHWEQSLQLVEPNDSYLPTRAYQGMAICLCRSGKPEAARNTLERGLALALRSGRERGILAIRIRLAGIDLDLGNTVTVETLADLKKTAQQYQDREHLALIMPIIFRFHILRGDLPAARAALAEAIDLFERLGMRRELAEARAELARLETPDAPLAGASGA
jgi:tetratricopeptide (TPR) repeat protein